MEGVFALQKQFISLKDHILDSFTHKMERTTSQNKAQIFIMHLGDLFIELCPRALQNLLKPDVCWNMVRPWRTSISAEISFIIQRLQ